MSQLTRCTVLLLVVHSTISITLDPVITPGSGGINTCPAQEEVNAVIQTLGASVRTIAQNLEYNPNCGPGLWYRVAYLNISDSSQQCPSLWREYNADGVRACGRPETSSGSCLPLNFTTSGGYSVVCGRATGYQVGGTDAFRYARVRTIDQEYVYGLSVTHGTPRNHIWTFAAGLSEVRHPTYPEFSCPCIQLSTPEFPAPPFVGNNYFCESGNPTNSWMDNHLFSTDPLWDGQQCEGQCCSNGKSPPWFSVELPNPTADDIEVRLCVPQPSHDDVAIQLLELYVQ